MGELLVVSEPPGWICRRLADLLVSGIPNLRVVDTEGSWVWQQYELVYYLPYYLYDRFPVGGAKKVALMTHVLTGDHEARYNRIARSVDHCVVLCSRYYGYLERLVGRGRLSLFQLPVHPLCRVRPLRVLWPHRSPSGYLGRKRYDWVERLKRLDWVELIETGGRLTPQELYSCMRNCDVVLVTSFCEAGPVSLLEALASGVVVVIGRGVGLQQDFEDCPGVVSFDVDSYDSMEHALWSLYQPRKLLADRVADWTEGNWVEQHRVLFERLCDEKASAV